MVLLLCVIGDKTQEIIDLRDWTHRYWEVRLNSDLDRKPGLTRCRWHLSVGGVGLRRCTRAAGWTRVCRGTRHTRLQVLHSTQVHLGTRVYPGHGHGNARVPSISGDVREIVLKSQVVVLQQWFEFGDRLKPNRLRSAYDRVWLRVGYVNVGWAPWVAPATRPPGFGGCRPSKAPLSLTWGLS